MGYVRCASIRARTALSGIASRLRADIDRAFFNQHSLAFLSHKGTTAPTRGLDRGLDWLKGFGGGLLTSCGPFNICTTCRDNNEELGLHGPHSNTAATLESVQQPDPRGERLICKSLPASGTDSSTGHASGCEGRLPCAGGELD